MRDNVVTGNCKQISHIGPRVQLLTVNKQMPTGFTFAHNLENIE